MSRWRKTTRDLACAACGDTGGHCSVSGKGDVCLCRKGIASPHPVKQTDGQSAYLHPMDGKAGARPAKRDVPSTAKPKLQEFELKKLLKEHARAMSSGRMTAACAALGLTEASLRAYGVGYCSESGALSFPMFDGEQKLIGIRLRLCSADAKKMCVRGSRNGLFIPADFDVATIPDTGVENDFEPLLLMLPEGPTSAAAAHACGFQAIGWPNNAIGGEMMSRLLQRCVLAGKRRDVVVVEDREGTKWAADGLTPFWPGPEGAIAHAAACLTYAKSVRVIKPPDGAKDLRKLINDRGSESPALVGARLVTMISAAEPWTHKTVRQKRAVAELLKGVCRAMLAGLTFADDKARDAKRASVLAVAKAMTVAGKAEGWLAGRKAVVSAA